VLSIVAILVLSLSALQARAQPFPSRNITLVVPSVAGGFADTIARLLAPSMQKALQRQVLVDNRSGAGAAIGSVARAEPDGHTLLLVSSSVTVIHEAARALGQKPPYEFSQLAPIAMITADASVVLVRNDAPWKTAKELFADAKNRPGQVSYASSGTFGSSHLIAEVVAQAVEAKLMHVPYRGGAPSMTALLTHDVDFTIQSPIVASQNAATGAVRAIGVTGRERVRSMPDVPTLKEQGVDAEVLFWSALFAPAEVPLSVREKILAALKEAMTSDGLRNQIERSGAEIHFLYGEDLERVLADESVRMTKIVKELAAKN
jgi:tripartite-type tricarboxylate transporter receptor subunit TctC